MVPHLVSEQRVDAGEKHFGLHAGKTMLATIRDLGEVADVWVPFVHGDQPGKYRERLGLSEEKEGDFLSGGGDSSSGREGNRGAAVKK